MSGAPLRRSSCPEGNPSHPVPAGWPFRAAILVAAVMLLSTGCRNPNAALTLPKEAGPVPVNLPRRETPAEHAYWEQLAPARVIYIGEMHNRDSDHEYELDVLKGLRARDVRFTVAWEMFEVPQQGLLDAWDEHHLSTDALLQKTDFQAHWGSLSVFYEKILRWTQAENVPSLALNAPAALSHKLAMGAPLDPAEHAELPTGFHPLPGGLEHFGEQMAQAPHGSANLENFYKAQLLWEQTMATRIVDFLAAHPDEKLVVLTGRGHVEGGFGVPAFVSQKTDAPQLVIFPGGAPPAEHPHGTIAWLRVFSPPP